MKATDLVVHVVRQQAVTFSGRTLRSVTRTATGLRVECKRPRSGRFETCIFPFNRVVAFCEDGDNGKAYVTVITDAHLVNIAGSGVIDTDGGWISVSDADGCVHLIRMSDDSNVDIVEGTSETASFSSFSEDENVVDLAEQRELRKRSDDDEDIEPPRRGRPRKEPEEQPVRGRGRPRKEPEPEPRRHGRPRKEEPVEEPRHGRGRPERAASRSLRRTERSERRASSAREVDWED